MELLQLLKSPNVNLNEKNAFLRYILITDGIKLNSDKTVAIHKAPRPDNFRNVCKLKFISNFISIIVS